MASINLLGFSFSKNIAIKNYVGSEISKMFLSHLTYEKINDTADTISSF